MELRLNRRALLCGGTGLIVFGVAGCQTLGTESEAAAAADDRTIEFDLWTGVPGVTFGSKIDVTSGSRRIHGPLAWTHPVTGERFQVYERLNREREGVKRQLYTLNGDGSALGRVFDSRPGQSDRSFVDDAFFPLGRWSRGERRSYPIKEIQDGKTSERIATIRIRRLSFNYREVPDSLKYDWILTDPSGTRIFDERFIYSPGTGFVKFINRMA